jgi:hypothetical protein
MEKQDYSKIDDDIADIDEIDAAENKINPEIYIHQALLKAQACLINPNIQDGFMQYRVLVEHIESLCKSAKILLNETEYKEKIKIKSDEIKQDNINLSSLELNTKLANTKLELLTEQIFKNKVINISLKGN